MFILKQERKLEAPGACLNTPVFVPILICTFGYSDLGWAKSFAGRTFYPEIYINEAAWRIQVRDHIIYEQRFILKRKIMDGNAAVPTAEETVYLPVHL
jgi:hypothetical protein